MKLIMRAKKISKRTGGNMYDIYERLHIKAVKSNNYIDLYC